MGFENYVSESEAASLTGIGVTTLRRFAEAGYFKVETESDGLRLYSTSELEKVFGLKSQPTATSSTPENFPAWEPTEQSISPESSRPLTTPAHQTNGHSPEVAIKTPEAAKLTLTPQLSTTELLTGNDARTTPRSTPDLTPQTQAVTQGSTVESARYEALERELQKQRTIFEMHERLLLIREEEIRSLKEEREWLRTRVEKLEEKGARDQLLLLSETQTIKALITIQEQRRSPIRQALEWLGFIPPTPIDIQPPRSAIDITESEKGAASKRSS
jgi:hypothetical protein